jgi:L-alanine-DL-glutamate epimerase-like enolase superfamily enzyme
VEVIVEMVYASSGLLKGVLIDSWTAYSWRDVTGWLHQHPKIEMLEEKIQSLGIRSRCNVLKITDVEIIHNRKPVALPEPWRPAWHEPDIKPQGATSFSFLKIYTDEGITGVGPCLPPNSLPPAYIAFVKSTLIGSDPFYVERFFETNMGGREATTSSLGGVDAALWDIIGKASGRPVYKLLGACRDRVPVYIATAQLHSPEEHAKEAVKYRNEGVRAIKLRLHRPNHEDDLEVVKAVRDAVGDDMDIMVDANQNNYAPSYNYWSRRTAMWMAKKLDALNVYFLEDPLPLRDVEGIKQLADAVDMNVSGGEHSNHVYQFRDLLFSGAFDIVQPDIIIGNPGIGISGIKRVAQIADSVGRMIVPHVYTGGISGLHLAATLQVMGTVKNCPFVEYPLEPPALTVETQHGLLKEPILIDRDGRVQVPQLPGIGVEINQEFVERYL